MNKIAGITLIELLIAMVIVTIAIALGIPSLNSFINENRLIAHTNEMVRTLNIARSESVKRGEIVTICKSPQSSPQCGDARNWKDGWVAFVDLNGDGVIDDGETVLETYPALAAGFSIVTGNNFSNRISYRPDGRSSNNDSIYVCSDQQTGRRIIIAVTGRIRTTDENDGCSGD